MKNPEEKAKELINIVYQPTGYLTHKHNSKFLWKWAAKIALGIVDEILEHVQMIEGEYEGYPSSYQYFIKVKELIKIEENE